MKATSAKTIGQSIMEYAILLAIVSAAFMAMSFYIKRSVQGKIYSMEGLVTAKSNQSSSSWLPPTFFW